MAGSVSLSSSEEERDGVRRPSINFAFVHP
jgi:hypothetical protein